MSDEQKDSLQTIAPGEIRSEGATSEAIGSLDSNQWQKPAELACSVFMLLVTGAAIDVLFVGSLPIWFSLRMTMITALVFLTSRSNVAALLFGLVLCWSFRDRTRSQLDLSLESIATVLLALCFLAFASRYQEIRRKFLDWILFIIAMDSDGKSAVVLAPETDIQWIFRVAFYGVKILIFVLFSLFLLGHQPWTLESEPWFNWTLANKQVLWPGPTLIVIIIGVFLFLSELAWRMRAERQKRMFLRSDGAKSLYPDLRRIR
jgi:hypothetical protein